MTLSYIRMKIENIRSVYKNRFISLSVKIYYFIFSFSIKMTFKSAENNFFIIMRQLSFNLKKNKIQISTSHCLENNELQMDVKTHGGISN